MDILEDVTYNEIAQYLPFSDMIALSMVNRAAQSLTPRLITDFAKECGYKGNDNKEAAKYLKELFVELDNLNQAKLIPEKHLVYLPNSKKLDARATLQNLKNASGEDFIRLFSYKSLYDKGNKIFNLFDFKNKDLNSKDASDQVIRYAENALFYAVHFNKVHLLECLLKNGIDPDISTNHYNHKPLSKAIRYNYSEAIKLLLDHGASPNKIGTAGLSPLQEACQKGNEDLIKILLKHDDIDVNQRLWGGGTILHDISTFGRMNLKIAKLLLEKGADPSILDRYGRTPLWYAANKPELHDLLDQYGTKYFNVHIDGESFYITQRQIKLKKTNALSTLENIEKILKNDAPYSSKRQDKFSKMPREELLKLLEYKADEIVRGHNISVARDLLPNALTNKAKVDALHDRIKKLINQDEGNLDK